MNCLFLELSMNIFILDLSSGNQNTSKQNCKDGAATIVNCITRYGGGRWQMALKQGFSDTSMCGNHLRLLRANFSAPIWISGSGGCTSDKFLGYSNAASGMTTRWAGSHLPVLRALTESSCAHLRAHTFIFFAQLSQMFHGISRVTVEASVLPWGGSVTWAVAPWQLQRRSTVCSSMLPSSEVSLGRTRCWKIQCWT